ncbi:hypothetical protein J1N51_00995 [Psychrosphaera ytuae]|uniref:Uncharacterized protein n=1 Tax=Psychrosphaera ytuae TaxID=2820710 RepID=A0A975HK96_9GAMM|nr:hypothetical protein [Psychrosphaera ytuae]QTH64094.1 hypothetical protein J1N51_00995 [Psychrosphaera ytuae]
MKKITLFTLLLSLGLSAVKVNAEQSQSYKLITVSTYLNFYLMNLNACEDFHPSTRAEAYKAEGQLYPFFERLDAKVKALDINADDKKAIKNTVTARRAKLNKQIADGEFTLEHCKAVIGLVNEGLDETLLSSIK